MKKGKIILSLFIAAAFAAVLFLNAPIRMKAVGSQDDSKPVRAIFSGAKVVTYREIEVDVPDAPAPKENPTSARSAAPTENPTSARAPETAGNLKLEEGPQSAESSDAPSSSDEPASSQTSQTPENPTSSGSSTSSETPSSSSEPTSSASSSSSGEPASSQNSSSSSGSGSGTHKETKIIEEIIDAPNGVAYYDNVSDAIADIKTAGAASAVIILDAGAKTKEPSDIIVLPQSRISLFLNGGKVGAKFSVAAKAELNVTTPGSLPETTLANGIFEVNGGENMLEITTGTTSTVTVPQGRGDFGLISEEIVFFEEEEDNGQDKGNAQENPAVKDPVRKVYLFNDLEAPEKAGEGYYYYSSSKTVNSEKLFIDKSYRSSISSIDLDIMRVPERSGLSLRNVTTDNSYINLTVADDIAFAMNGINSLGTSRDYYFGEALVHLAVNDAEAASYAKKDDSGNILKPKAFCPDSIYIIDGSFTLTDVVWNVSSGHMTSVIAGAEDISVSYEKGSADGLRTWKITGKTVAERVKVYWLCDEDGAGNVYTVNEKEKESLEKEGFEYKGIAFKAPTESKVPIYAAYDQNGSKEYFYTSDNAAYRALLNKGWRGKGIVFYGSDTKDMYPVYRQSNQYTGRNNFTPSTHEKNVLVNEKGWTDEGAAWYAEAPGDPVSED